jgi:hypothetical protein
MARMSDAQRAEMCAIRNSRDSGPNRQVAAGSVAPYPPLPPLPYHYHYPPSVVNVPPPPPPPPPIQISTAGTGNQQNPALNGPKGFPPSPGSYAGSIPSAYPGYPPYWG